MMAYNKRFTNQVTRSVLEIRSPHFYARPSQARALRKRSGFVFPGTDRVTWLVNRYHKSEYSRAISYRGFALGYLKMHNAQQQQQQQPLLPPEHKACFERVCA